MRKRSGLSALLLVLMLVMAPLAAAVAGVSVTDSVGRTVTVPEPEQLQKVYVTSPVGFIFMYTLDFERLAGTPMKFNEQELKYLNPACADMFLNELFGFLRAVFGVVFDALNKHAQLGKTAGFRVVG